MSAPDLSVIVPIFNRGEIIRYTLESVRRASAGLNVELVVVDDGSTPPVAGILARLGCAPALIHRQENRGLLFARLAGLERAAGRNVLFLDSDDLVGPDKFRAQLAAMAAAGADVSSTDVARCVLEGPYDSLRIETDAPEEQFSDCAGFYLLGQPPPHGPIFRTDYLRAIVRGAFFPPLPLYNGVAEIWFYHNAAPAPGRAIHVPGAHTIVGSHPGTRLTGQWERLAVASLAVVEAFARSCPLNDATLRARQCAGIKAFRSWRRLPSQFSREFEERLIGVWRRLPKGDRRALGGRGFQMLGRILGPAAAGRALRRWQCRPYEQVRTLTDVEFAGLLATLPPP